MHFFWFSLVSISCLCMTKKSKRLISRLYFESYLQGNHLHYKIPQHPIFYVLMTWKHWNTHIPWLFPITYTNDCVLPETAELKMRVCSDASSSNTPIKKHLCNALHVLCTCCRLKGKRLGWLKAIQLEVHWTPIQTAVCTASSPGREFKLIITFPRASHQIFMGSSRKSGSFVVPCSSQGIDERSAIEQ